MATTKDYLDFVCTQLEGIRGVVKNHPALAHLLAEAPEGLPYPGAKPQKILDVEDRVLTAQVLEILERITPVSRRRAQKTCGTL